MADQGSLKDVHLLKSTKISVFVDEALQDMLVVTYEYGVKLFKGVLLDSNKRNIPCGVPNLHPVFHINTTNKKSLDEDLLYSVNQRYAYMDPNHSKPKNVRFPSKYKNNKMTVRLRPRQVLCSKCKGICNENSENISKKRKSQENIQPPTPKRAANAPLTRSVYLEQLNKKKVEQKLQPSLIPKLSRLLPQEISNALNGNLENLNCSGEKSRSEDKPKKESCESSDFTVNKLDKAEPASILVENRLSTQDPEITIRSVKRTLRKKRSVGSMEDLWDESVFEEGANLKNIESNSNNNCSTTLSEQSQNTSNSINTRTIKICYGPQGEGTVLKIPAPIEKFDSSDDLEENVITPVNQITTKEDDNKAARKALKRARKKARQNVILPASSPNYIQSLSPRYSIGGTSPRYPIVGASPRHTFGNNSPRYITSTSELNLPRRHKHKLKRKKKHRDVKDKRHKEDEVTTSQENVGKEQILSQKLSISLKRRNNTYTSCQNLSDVGDENTSSSDEHDLVPDFPQCSPTQSVNTQSISSALGFDGSRLLIGDVVWGKLLGFPWWPGKITSILSSGNQAPQANVSWYGSSTSSLLNCDQVCSYLENLKVRYNKKKRGAYKEAVRQATLDAEAKIRKETTAVSSPTHPIITVPPPPLASPREIDVMS